MEPLAVGRMQASKLIGVSLRTLDALLARGEIRGRRIGRRVVFTLEELKRFLSRDHHSDAGAGARDHTTRTDGPASLRR
jgi:excisionase family DNA binding protein